MSIVRMDQKFVNTSLQVPPGKRRIELVDEATPGLYIEVRTHPQVKAPTGSVPRLIDAFATSVLGQPLISLWLRPARPSCK